LANCSHQVSFTSTAHQNSNFDKVVLGDLCRVATYIHNAKIVMNGISTFGEVVSARLTSRRGRHITSHYEMEESDEYQ